MRILLRVGLPTMAVLVLWTLGVALVTSDPRLARERAEKILRYMENAPDTRVTDHQTEVI